MNSQHHNDEKVNLSRNKNLIDEIVNIAKFKKLDDRYIITDICRNMNFKYEFDGDICNVYHSSFGFSLSFNEKNCKSLAGFIDIKLFGSQDKQKFISFLKNVIENKEILISENYLKNILDKVLDKNVKEISKIENKTRIYVSKIMSDERELIFITMELNA